MKIAIVGAGAMGSGGRITVPESRRAVSVTTTGPPGVICRSNQAMSSGQDRGLIVRGIPRRSPVARDSRHSRSRSRGALRYGVAAGARHCLHQPARHRRHDAAQLRFVRQW